ncbi:MAG: glycosyl transferase [Desulfobacteraceae bacterium 4484_190.1]|nr:MAG: glycosyl transferase [Desulfobacteraceae bacterium 4484_190.1]
MVEIFFIGSIFMTFFAYFGYPFSLYLLSIFRRKVVKKANFFPRVTMIITAHNEEKRIKDKLDNTLVLEYPGEKLQILVASDGSTDQTNAIVKDYEKKGIELLAIGERRGKEKAQKEAVKRANGEVIIFTDVATHLGPVGLKEIIFNFADPSVGCVSSEDRLVGKDGNPSGEGFYVRYEMWLRRLESKVNSLVGLSGSFFAARKEVCQGFSGKMQSDFRTLLSSIKMGLRGISDPQAIGYYADVSNEKQEFDRKVRTVVRGLTVFFRHLEFLNMFRYGFFSYQFFCHKLLRWLVPFFLCIALVSNLILAVNSYLFLILLFGQLIFYGLAFWGWKHQSGASKIFVKIPMYFLIVNASIFVAWWRYLRGQRLVMWTPSER